MNINNSSLLDYYRFQDNNHAAGSKEHEDVGSANQADHMLFEELLSAAKQTEQQVHQLPRHLTEDDQFFAELRERQRLEALKRLNLELPPVESDS